MDKPKRFYLPSPEGLVEVTAPVYYAYYKERRHAKYLVEQEESHGVVSYHALDDDEFVGEELIPDPSAPSTEEQVFAMELHDLLHRSIRTLPEEDQALLWAIFYEGQTDRDYGKILGISHTAVRKRRERILAKLRKLMIFSRIFFF